jgi:hypothetical protein
MSTLRPVRDGGEAYLEPEGLQEPIQRVLRGVVARVEASQEIRAGDPHLGGELLHAHRSNNFAKRDLKRNFLSRRFEQFDRIAVLILDLDLLAARSGLHVVSKTNAGLLQRVDERREIIHTKHDTIPPARVLLLTARHRPGSGGLWTAQQERRVPERDAGERRKLLMLQREAQLCRVERDRADDILRLISDAMHELDERVLAGALLVSLLCRFDRSRHLFFSLRPCGAGEELLRSGTRSRGLKEDVQGSGHETPAGADGAPVAPDGRMDRITMKPSRSDTSAAARTIRAAPHIQSVRRIGDDRIKLQRAFNAFDRWGRYRAIVQFAAFFTNVWALVSLTDGKAAATPRTS